MQEIRHGALHVMVKTEDKGWIDRLLRDIDPDLFCELQVTVADERPVWCVVEDTHVAEGPDRYVTVYEFRGPSGEPVPYLSEAIVDEMRKRARARDRRESAAQIARRRNSELREQRQRSRDEELEDARRDMHRMSRRSAAIHRSPGLARSRARAESTRNESLRAAWEAARIAAALERRSRSMGLRAA